MNVSVIIRTKGDAERAALLPRAIGSVLTQEGVDVELIVVLNGVRYDDDLMHSLRNNERIRCAVLDGPDLAKATEAGRALVTSEYFSFLDDDDEYLPNALARRAEFLDEHTHVDCVVTNGEYACGSHTRPVIANIERCSKDLAASILRGENWLPSCAGTFRSGTVTKEYTDRLLPSSREWTLLAFRMVSALNVSLINDITYRINATPQSESTASEKYMRGAVDAMLQIQRWNRDPKHVRAINRALAKARHELSSFYRINGDFRQAWALHWQSVRSEQWWKYLPYTLILATGSRRKVSSLLRLSRANQTHQ